MFANLHIFADVLHIMLFLLLSNLHFLHNVALSADSRHAGAMRPPRIKRYTPQGSANQLLFETRFSDRFWNDFLMISGCLLDIFFMIFYVLAPFLEDQVCIAFFLDVGVTFGIVFDVFLDTFTVLAGKLLNPQQHVFLQ